MVNGAIHRMPRLVGLVGLVGGGALLSGYPVSQVVAECTPLFEITAVVDSPGGFSVSPLGMNDYGHICGHYAAGEFGQRAFYWTPEAGFVDFLPPSGTTSRAYDINNNGIVVGQYQNALRGFVYDTTTGELTELDPPYRPTGQCEVRGVNDLNQVAGYRTVAPGVRHGMIWSAETGYIDVAPTYGEDARLSDINDDGVAVGRMGDSPFFAHVMVATIGGEVTDLGTVPGAQSGDGRGISNTGFVVGEGLVGDTVHSALWQKPLAIDLGQLPGTPFTRASAVNDAGWVVGEAHNFGLTDLTAFLWLDGQIHNLAELTTGLAGNSHLDSARDTNQSGQIVCRADINGSLVALVLTPTNMAGDVNLDCKVDGADLGLLLGSWGTNQANADFDGSGEVDPGDLEILLNNWSD